MANDPLYINASGGVPAYSAGEERQAMALPMLCDARAMGGRAGVRPGAGQLQVSLVGSTITVAPGVAYIDPALTAAQGGYWVAITPASTHTLTAAHPTNPRKDIVILRVYDHDEDTSGLREARTEYIVGTAAPSPVEPTPPGPSGWLRLATIDVPANGSPAPSVTNNMPFTAASGGLLPVRSQADRDSLSQPYGGLAVYRMDLQVVQFYTGVAWRNAGPVIVGSQGARDALTGVYDGMQVWRTDIDTLNVYDGAGWRYLGKPQTNTVAGLATSGSTSYVDLSSPGPAVTLETGTTAEVKITGFQFNSNATSVCYMGYAVSGATTIAASDAKSLRQHSETANGQGMMSATYLETGLTPGSNTFTAKYRVNGGTGGWSDRSIIVTPY